MSSYGSCDSLLCSSPSDNKNFSSSTDDASKSTSSNSLNMIVMNDSLIPDKETNKMDEHERSATLEAYAIIPDSIDNDTANDISKEHLVEVSMKKTNETGTNSEGQDFGGEASATEETSCSSSGGKTKSRKRLREKVEDDEDDDDAMNENAREGRTSVMTRNACYLYVCSCHSAAQETQRRSIGRNKRCW